MDVFIKRVCQNQTINTSTISLNFHNDFNTPESIMKYLESKSKYINPIYVKELARGGEAVVYRVEHKNLDEVVVKCSLN